MLIFNFLIPIFGLLIAKFNLIDLESFNPNQKNYEIDYQQQSDYYATFQQSKNAFFTLVTTSTTNDITEKDASISTVVITTNSYIYDSFTLNIVTKIVYSYGNITKLNTESSIIEKSKSQGLITTKYKTNLQLSCSIINEKLNVPLGNTSLWLYSYSFAYFKAIDLINNFYLNPNVNSITCSQDGQIFSFPLFENLVTFFILLSLRQYFILIHLNLKDQKHFKL